MHDGQAVKVNAYFITISSAVPLLLQVLNISLTFGVGIVPDVRDLSRVSVKSKQSNVGSKVDQFGNTVD